MSKRKNKKFYLKSVESIDYGDEVVFTKENSGYIVGVDLAKGNDYSLNVPYLDKLLRDED